MTNLPRSLVSIAVPLKKVSDLTTRRYFMIWDQRTEFEYTPPDPTVIQSKQFLTLLILQNNI